MNGIAWIRWIGLIVALVLMGTSSLDAATLKLTNNSLDEDNPQINSAGHVVWEEVNGPNSEIYF